LKTYLARPALAKRTRPIDEVVRIEAIDPTECRRDARPGTL